MPSAGSQARDDACRTVIAAGEPGQMHAAGAITCEERHMQAAKEHGASVEEVCRRADLRLDIQERPSALCWSRSARSARNARSDPPIMTLSAGDALGSYSIHTGSVYEDCLPGHSRTHWALDTDSESRLKHQKGGCVTGTHRVERPLGDEVASISLEGKCAPRSSERCGRHDDQLQPTEGVAFELRSERSRRRCGQVR